MTPGRRRDRWLTSRCPLSSRRRPPHPAGGVGNFKGHSDINHLHQGGPAACVVVRVWSFLTLMMMHAAYCVFTKSILAIFRRQCSSMFHVADCRCPMCTSAELYMIHVTSSNGKSESESDIGIFSPKYRNIGHRPFYPKSAVL